MRPFPGGHQTCRSAGARLRRWLKARSRSAIIRATSRRRTQEREQCRKGCGSRVLRVHGWSTQLIEPPGAHARSKTQDLRAERCSRLRRRSQRNPARSGPASGQQGTCGVSRSSGSVASHLRTAYAPRAPGAPVDLAAICHQPMPPAVRRRRPTATCGFVTVALGDRCTPSPTASPVATMRWRYGQGQTFLSPRTCF